MTGSNYARFRRVAKTIEVHEDYHAQWGTNLYTALKKYGPLTARRVAKRFSSLSDSEPIIACKEMERFVDRNKPTILLHRILFNLTAGLEAMWHAYIIAITLPTYLSLAAPGTTIRGQFVRVSALDYDNTNPLSFLTSYYPEHRIDKLHGYMMQEMAPEDAILDEDSEWFGEHRDAIIPIWQNIIHDGTFTRDRVQALIQGSSNGTTTTLLEGSL